ncbi:MAG: type II toxin-antitoxin system RelB/DinJ family antitoxin [Patescibacteria group bacterium]
MNIQTTLQIRVDDSLKEKASQALKRMGLDLSSGIKLFLNEVAMTETIPFLPSTEKGKKLRGYETYKKEAEFLKKHGKRFTSGKELIDDILK